MLRSGKRAEGLGVKAGKERQRARVKGLDGEVESGSDDTKFAGFNMGARGDPGLSVVLLRIWQEMSVAVGDHAADAAGLHGATGYPSGRWQRLGVAS